MFRVKLWLPKIDAIPDRWTYLEKNIDNVMWNLQEGLDMKTYMYVKDGICRI